VNFGLKSINLSIFVNFKLKGVKFLYFWLFGIEKDTKRGIFGNFKKRKINLLDKLELKSVKFVYFISLH
jgi:hypothetical protein